MTARRPMFLGRPIFLGCHRLPPGHSDFLSASAANYVPEDDPRQFGYEDRDGNWHPMTASSKQRYYKP